MPRFYITRTVHGPVTAHGSEIRNSFGVVIATVSDRTGILASALADLINLGLPVARANEDAEDAREDAMRATLLRSR